MRELQSIVNPKKAPWSFLDELAPGKPIDEVVLKQKGSMVTITYKDREDEDSSSKWKLNGCQLVFLHHPNTTKNERLETYWRKHSRRRPTFSKGKILNYYGMTLTSLDLGPEIDGVWNASVGQVFTVKGRRYHSGNKAAKFLLYRGNQFNGSSWEFTDTWTLGDFQLEEKGENKCVWRRGRESKYRERERMDWTRRHQVSHDSLLASSLNASSFEPARKTRVSKKSLSQEQWESAVVGRSERFHSNAPGEDLFYVDDIPGRAEGCARAASCTRGPTSSGSIAVSLSHIRMRSKSFRTTSISSISERSRLGPPKPSGWPRATAQRAACASLMRRLWSATRPHKAPRTNPNTAYSRPGSAPSGPHPAARRTIPWRMPRGRPNWSFGSRSNGRGLGT